MTTFIKLTTGNLEWDGAARPHGVTLWCADGDGLITVLSNARHCALFDQGDFVQWLPKNITDALTQAAAWIAAEYPEIHADFAA
jgi:hypothetical protein